MYFSSTTPRQRPTCYQVSCLLLFRHIRPALLKSQLQTSPFIELRLWHTIPCVHTRLCATYLHLLPASLGGTQAPASTGEPHTPLFLYESKILTQRILMLLDLPKKHTDLPPSPSLMTSVVLTSHHTWPLYLAKHVALQHSPHKGYSLHVHESSLGWYYRVLTNTYGGQLCQPVSTLHIHKCTLQLGILLVTRLLLSLLRQFQCSHYYT